MINVYNKKIIPTDYRDAIRRLIDRLKQEEVFKIHDIVVEFGNRKARNLGNPLSGNDISCELSIGMKLSENIFEDVASTGMVYSIYCDVTNHIETLDLSLAHEFGHILMYINNFETKIALSVNFDMADNHIIAYNYIDELFANYYATSILNEINPGYSEELARKVYVVMNKLMISTDNRSNIIDLLIEVNSGILGFVYNLAELVATIHKVDKNSRLFIDNSFGEPIHQLEELSVSILDSLLDKADLDINILSEIDRLIKEIKIIYE